MRVRFRNSPRRTVEPGDSGPHTKLAFGALSTGSEKRQTRTPEGRTSRPRRPGRRGPRFRLRPPGAARSLAPDGVAPDGVDGRCSPALDSGS